MNLSFQYTEKVRKLSFILLVFSEFKKIFLGFLALLILFFSAMNLIRYIQPAVVFYFWSLFFLCFGCYFLFILRWLFRLWKQFKYSQEKGVIVQCSLTSHSVAICNKMHPESGTVIYYADMESLVMLHKYIFIVSKRGNKTLSIVIPPDAFDSFQQYKEAKKLLKTASGSPACVKQSAAKVVHQGCKGIKILTRYTWYVMQAILFVVLLFAGLFILMKIF